MLREAFVIDWAAALTSSLAKDVERLFPGDAHRWPLLRVFDATAYQWADGWVLLTLSDRSTGGIPTVEGSPVPRPCPMSHPEAPTVDNITELHDLIIRTMGLRAQDAVLLVPVLPGDSSSVEGDWEQMDDLRRQLWHRQMELTISRQWYWLKGFDVSGSFFIPPGYEGLADACRSFFADHPDYECNVFLMTQFGSAGHLEPLDNEVRGVLRKHGLNPVRADDRVYATDRSLWHNVCVYMLCCSKGVAILEDRGKDEFNPNVGIEYGFMRALNKPTLLLVDNGFRNLRADVIGTLREEFDLLDIPATVPPAVERWLRDLKLLP